MLRFNFHVGRDVCFIDYFIIPEKKLFYLCFEVIKKKWTRIYFILRKYTIIDNPTIYKRGRKKLVSWDRISCMSKNSNNSSCWPFYFLCQCKFYSYSINILTIWFTINFILTFYNNFFFPSNTPFLLGNSCSYFTIVFEHMGRGQGL